MKSDELHGVVNQAHKQWKKMEYPDDFHAVAQTSLGPTLVHIYHHETFPSGGRTFTADVRQPEGGQHLGRLKIHIV